MAQDFENEKYGYKMHFPDNALPPEVDECQVHVESSLCGQFQFPENIELISGVYWITTGQKFVEPVIVEFQHCAKPEHVENLTIVVTWRTVRDLPYKFSILDGELFSLGTDYGRISLTHFCGVAVASQSPPPQSLLQRLKHCFSGTQSSDVRKYLTRFYYSKGDSHTWDVYFVIIWNTKLHIAVSIIIVFQLLTAKDLYSCTNTDTIMKQQGKDCGDITLVFSL